MANADVDVQLRLFKRQYLQLFEPDFLAWPSPKLLKSADVQTWLFRHLFDESRNPRLPHRRYQYLVLKPLLAKIEQAIEDPEEDDISDDLMNHMASLLTHGVPSELQAIQEKAFVTFTCLPQTHQDDSSTSGEPTITLLERRHLILGSRTTGFRTWEASLHLGSYLLSNAGADLVSNKNVLELGAGTGFLSILCAKHLQAKYVTATDGDERVVESLGENLELNDLDEKKVSTQTLWWGEEIKGTWLERDCISRPYDIVVGADITYDPEAISVLFSTVQQLFDLRPQLVVIFASVIRNSKTFQTVLEESDKRRFSTTEIDFVAKPIRAQKALFYAAAVMPIKILSITRPT